MVRHLIASIESLQYHNSSYARLTVNVFEQKLELWVKMKLSKNTCSSSSDQFLFTIKTIQRPDGEILHFAENISAWKAPTEEKPSLPPPKPYQRTTSSAKLNNLSTRGR